MSPCDSEAGTNGDVDVGVVVCSHVDRARHAAPNTDPNWNRRLMSLAHTLLCIKNGIAVSVVTVMTEHSEELTVFFMTGHMSHFFARAANLFRLLFFVCVLVMETCCTVCGAA